MNFVSARELFIIVLCFHMTQQDWVEIPQNTSSKDKSSVRTSPKIKTIIRYEANVTRAKPRIKIRTEKTIIEVLTSTTTTTTPKPISTTTTLAPLKNVTEKTKTKEVKNVSENVKPIDYDDDIEEEDESVENSEKNDVDEENDDLDFVGNEVTPNEFSVSGLIPYIKQLQEKVMKHLPNGITNKIRMLETFRDNLFHNIGKKF